MTATHKLLLRLVREAMRTGSDRITSRIGNPNTYEKLRSLGYFATSNEDVVDRLTAHAFEAIFDTFEQIECPARVQTLVEEMGVTGLRWRRAGRFINQNQAQPLVCTIFIKDPATAQISSWFHELGHVLFHLGEEGSCSWKRQGVNREKAARLAATAKSVYPIIPSLANPPIPDEKCIQLVEGRAYGFTHHGPEGEDEELFAILFGEHCAGFDLHPRVKAAVEEIISDLKTT